MEYAVERRVMRYARSSVRYCHLVAARRISQQADRWFGECDVRPTRSARGEEACRMLLLQLLWVPLKEEASGNHTRLHDEYRAPHRRHS